MECDKKRGTHNIINYDRLYYGIHVVKFIKLCKIPLLIMSISILGVLITSLN